MGCHHQTYIPSQTILDVFYCLLSDIFKGSLTKVFEGVVSSKLLGSIAFADTLVQQYDLVVELVVVLVEYYAAHPQIWQLKSLQQQEGQSDPSLLLDETVPLVKVW